LQTVLFLHHIALLLASPQIHTTASERQAAPTVAQCENSTQRLARLQADEATPWSAQNGAAALYEIWSHPDCVEHRKKSELDVGPELERNIQRLGEQSTALAEQLALGRSRCEQQETARWNAATDEYKSLYPLTDLIDRCFQNARVVAYGNIINQRFEDAKKARQAQVEELEAEEIRKKKEYDEGYQKWLAEKSAADAARQRWQERKQLCESGQYEYCKAE